MDKGSADDRALFKAMEYLSYLLDTKWKKSNGGKAYMEIAIGEVRDISKCMEFTFWQRFSTCYMMTISLCH